MSDGLDISDYELNAYIDGELDADRTRAVAARLASDPALASRVAGYQSDMAMLKKIYGPMADPAQSRPYLALKAQGRRHFAPSWRLTGAIAALLLLAIGLSPLAYRLWSAGPFGEIVTAALAARQEPGEKTLNVAGNALQYDAAVSAAVSEQVKVPDLAKMGYHLVSIRLYPSAPGGSAAEFLYRDQANRLFSVYLRHSDGTARFDQFERQGLRVCVWQDDQLGMVMAGDVTTAAMQRLASLAYAGLTL